MERSGGGEQHGVTGWDARAVPWVQWCDNVSVPYIHGPWRHLLGEGWTHRLWWLQLSLLPWLKALCWSAPGAPEPAHVRIPQHQAGLGLISACPVTEQMSQAQNFLLPFKGWEAAFPAPSVTFPCSLPVYPAGSLGSNPLPSIIPSEIQISLMAAV